MLGTRDRDRRCATDAAELVIWFLEADAQPVLDPSEGYEKRQDEIVGCGRVYGVKCWSLVIRLSGWHGIFDVR